MKNDNNRWVDLSNGVAWAIIFSLAAIIMSICALVHKCPRVYEKGNLGFDYLGVIVGILALLVTFLVAWQIWQTMASREEIKEARLSAKKANKVAEDVKLLNKEFKESLDLFAAYRASSDGLSFLLHEKHYKAFHLFATAIIDSLKFLNDQGKCAMGALVNLDNCMDYDERHPSLNKYKENWDSVVLRLGEIEDALHRAEQENLLFQTFAKDKIEKFKNSARAKGFKI